MLNVRLCDEGKKLHLPKMKMMAQSPDQRVFVLGS
jgi:hypothetical protein